MRHFDIVIGFEESAILPTRKTPLSAGYDLHIVETKSFKPGEIWEVNTGVTAWMEPDEVLLITMKSGAPYAIEAVLANGVGVVNAADYGKPIKLIIRSLGDVEFQLNKGDVIAKGIFTKYLTVDGDEIR